MPWNSLNIITLDPNVIKTELIIDKCKCSQDKYDQIVVKFVG